MLDIDLVVHIDDKKISIQDDRAACYVVSDSVIDNVLFRLCLYRDIRARYTVD